jgi:hypothetical protein
VAETAGFHAGVPLAIWLKAGSIGMEKPENQSPGFRVDL